MLDLFCGSGLGAHGYWRSGRFSEIVGVDHENQAAYSFDFIQADALSLTYDFLLQFDFIHASPPCQAYSKVTPDASIHPRLITGTKLMLAAAGVPHVVENVEGSSRELRPNLVVDGHYFGLPAERRRYFYVSTLEAAQRLMCSGQSLNVHGSAYISREQVIKSMGLKNHISTWSLSHIPITGMEQGIPPVITRYIAGRVFPKKYRIG